MYNVYAGADIVTAYGTKVYSKGDMVKENLSEEEAKVYIAFTNLLQRGFGDIRISEQAAVIAAYHSELAHFACATSAACNCRRSLGVSSCTK